MEKEKNLHLKDTLRYLKKTYRYAKKDKKYLFFFLLTTILECVVIVVVPWLEARQILALTDNIWEQLFFISIAIFLVEIGRNFVRFFNSFFIWKFFYSVKTNIQIEMAKETLKIDTATLNQNSSGVFIERIGNDTESLANIFTTIIDYATYLLSNFGILVSIFFLNKFIFLIYIIYLALDLLLQKYSTDKIQQKRRILRKNNEKASSFATEMVRGAKDIKILNAEKSFIAKGKTIVEEANTSGWNYNITRNCFRLIGGTLYDILNLSIVILGIYCILNHQLEVATLVIIFSYRGNIASISNNIEWFLDSLKSFTLASERVFEIIDSSKFPKEKFGTKHLDKATGNIEFKDVYFHYEDKLPVLKGMSFKVKPNETVSFVGRSGAGKSTLFNLIAGLYYPIQGKILIDGIPTSELDKESLRGNLSVISQNPYIFNMSIRENLQIIKKDLTEEKMIEACKMACLHDFILTLKDGYDTVVGEGGVTLSGGQRQRLAIARALVQETEIILFDEATSALDNETQYEIQKSIQNMQGKYTILIIAHRLSTVIHSDRILLVEEGKIIDEGSHEELLQKNELYRHLYELELEKEE